MDLQIQKLSKKHLPMVNAFSCIETQQHLNQYNSKERRRILKHSKEMDSFLKTEAYKEQEDGLNTTHLLIDSEMLDFRHCTIFCKYFKNMVGCTPKQYRDSKGLSIRVE